MKAATTGEITRARVIREATTLINKQGFNNTTINDIINFTGVKKGNLYYHFPSKEALGEAILDEIRLESASFLEKVLQGRSSMEKISNYLDAVFDKHKDKNFVGGCLIGNTAIEMGDNNLAFAGKITQIFAHWKRYLAPILSEAKVAGELKLNMEPDILANHIVAVVEGGIMMAKASKDETDLKNCLDSLRLILGLEVKD